MKCLKCGAYVYSSDKFCRSCGSELTNDTCQYGDNITNSKYDASSCHSKQYNYSYTYSNTQKDSATTYTNTYDYKDKFTFDYSKFAYTKPTDSGGDDKYLKAYIGPKYQKIKQLKFSWPALIFGPYYLIYRKVWKYAIAIIIILIAATALLSTELSDFINIITHIALAFKFKEIYMKQAEEHVENIKQQSLDKTTQELLDICQKKGGTIAKKLIVTIIILISTAFFITGIIYGYQDFNYNSENDTNEQEELQYEQPSTLSDISYILPYGFSKTYTNNDYQKYVYYINNYTTCNITIDKNTMINIYPDEKTYLERQAKTASNLDYQISPIAPITFNNQIWQYIHLETTRLSETHYAKKIENAIYTIKTFDYKTDTDSHIKCNEKYQDFLNTITIKNNL